MSEPEMGETIAALVRSRQLTQYADLQTKEIPPNLVLVATKLRAFVSNADCPRWITRSAAAVHVKLGDDESRRIAHELVIEHDILDSEIGEKLLELHVTAEDAPRIAALLASEAKHPKAVR